MVYQKHFAYTTIGESISQIRLPSRFERIDEPLRISPYLKKLGEIGKYININKDEILVIWKD